MVQDHSYKSYNSYVPDPQDRLVETPCMDVFCTRRKLKLDIFFYLHNLLLPLKTITYTFIPVMISYSGA